MMMCEEEASWSRLRVCGEAHDRCDGVGVREARSFEPCGAAVCVLRVAVDGSVRRRPESSLQCTLYGRLESES